MGRRGRKGRNVRGVLLLDKPKGDTSNGALQRVKRIYNAQKAGHTGSLDPLATGLLPICFGSATKLSAFLLDADKSYWVQVRLGATTTTGDTEGGVLETAPTDQITATDVSKALEGFRGEIQQIPPMYSALKHKGERLYKLAREGREVEREPRTISIYELRLQSCDVPSLELEVRCSKGTYVRTLAEDIGGVLGCGAHVTDLRRTGVGPYDADHSITIEQLETAAQEGYKALDGLLVPAESALANRPAVTLNPDSTFYVKQGQPVLVPNAPTEGQVRLFDPNGLFIGVGEILEDGRVAPKRLM